MDQNTFQQSTPQQALRTLRIIWCAMLAGMIGFGILLLFIMNPEASEQEPLYIYLSFGLLVSTTPLGYFIRMTTYKQGWEANRIKPEKYVTGNQILLAMIEGPAFLSLVFTLLLNHWGLHSIPAGIGVLLFLINFPTGKAMMDTPSEYETKSEDEDGVVTEK